MEPKKYIIIYLHIQSVSFRALSLGEEVVEGDVDFSLGEANWKHIRE